MSNLWYKVADYGDHMREPDWLRVPEDNEPAPIEGKFKFFDIIIKYNIIN
jgi:hypothetical protein